MLYSLLKSKIYGAVVTAANVDYEGSITIDRDLMDAAGFFPFEKVLVADMTNGARLETYVIEGKRGSGEICMNGAAAHQIHVGDRVIILSFVLLDPEERKKHEPKRVVVNGQNKVIS